MLANFVLWREGPTAFPGAPAGRHRGSREKAPVDVRAALEGRASDDVSAATMRARRRRAAGRRPRCRRHSAWFRETMALARAWRRQGDRFAGPALRDLRAGRSREHDARAARPPCHARALCRLAVAHGSRRHPRGHRADAGPARRAGGELGCAGRPRLQEGLLYRAGDHRAHAVSRAAQGAAVRLPRRGGRRARGDARLRTCVRGPGVRNVVNAARRPTAAATSSRSCSSRPSRPARCVSTRRTGRRSRRCPCRTPSRRRPRRAVASARRRKAPMCLALLAQDAHPRFAVVIAANRDEHHARPAAPAAWWAEGILAGRDLEAGGTWLGVTRTGRWALITNIREPDRRDPGAPSRGALVTRVLADAASPAENVAAIVADAAAYNGFNLIAGDLTSRLPGLESRGRRAQRWNRAYTASPTRSSMRPGPRSSRTKAALAAWCARDADDLESLFAVLADRTRTPDARAAGDRRFARLGTPALVAVHRRRRGRLRNALVDGRRARPRRRRALRRADLRPGRPPGRRSRLQLRALSCLSGPRISARSR